MCTLCIVASICAPNLGISLSLLLHLTAFEGAATSGSPCLPTEDQPGLRIAVTVVDPSVITTTDPVTTPGKASFQYLLTPVSMHYFIAIFPFGLV